MGVAKDKWTELHDANEAREVLNLCVRISTVDDTGKVEQFGTIVDFSPETMFQTLLGGLERLCLFNEVEMSQYANDLGKTMRLQDVEELHGLHLEAVVSIDHEQTDIHHFRNIDHGGERVGRTFYECEAAALRGNDGKRSGWRGKRLLGVAPDQTLDERGLAHT